ncbi:MAG: thrombospondin type 3 repeat-containing protein [Candidatus Cloacimonetes bacterium]|nr:thrombospondin type 3 repeat-containing protein [Candidatus Cloacimonadota bacterium]
MIDRILSIFLCILILCTLSVSLYAVPDRGDVIISEVILDDDGVYAAIPRRAGIAHTAETDIIVELKNISGQIQDFTGLRLFYIIEPYALTHPDNNQFDICGMSVGTAHIQSMDITVASGEQPNNISAGDFFVIQEYGPSTQLYPTNGTKTGIMFRKNAPWVPVSLPLHRYPGIGGNYTTAPQNLSYHTFMLGSERGNTGTNLGNPTLIDSAEFSEPTTEYTNGGTAPIAQIRGLPRYCVGNKFTNDGHFTKDGLDDDPGGALSPVGAQNLTILLFSTNGGATVELLDVFSIGPAGAQIDLDSILSDGGTSPAIALLLAANGINPFTPYTFNFAGSTLEMFDLANGDDNTLLGAGTKGLHEVSFQRQPAAENRASNSRNDFFKGSASKGTGLTLPPDGGGDMINTAAVSLNRRGNAAGADILVNTSPTSPGDTQSRYKVIVTTAVPVSAIDATIIRVGVGPVGPARPMVFAGSQWTLELNNVLSAITDVTEYQIRFLITPVSGAPGDVTPAGTSFFAKSFGPGITMGTRTPSGSGPFVDTSSFSIDASLLDTGTINFNSANVYLVTTNGARVSGAPDRPLVCDGSTGSQTCSTTAYSLSGISVNNQIQYCFRVDATDEFLNSGTNNNCNSPFTVTKRPALKSTASVTVAPGTTETIDISNTSLYLDSFNFQGAITFALESSSAYATCVLSGTMVTITAATVGSGGSCRFTVTGQGLTPNTNQLLTVIADPNATVLEDFKLAPGLNPLLPGQLTNKARVSVSDFLEIEARLTDAQGIDSTVGAQSVVLHFVATSVPGLEGQTIYSFFMYNDGTDIRTASGAPPGAAFGTRHLYGYSLNDNNRITPNASVSPGGFVSFPQALSPENYYSFRIDPPTPDDRWHLAIKPFLFQITTDFQLDLEVTDLNANKTYLPNVGNVSVAAGPGFVLKPVKDTINEGDTSERTIALRDYECNGPPAVGTRKCGGAGNNPLNGAEHDALVWYVDSFDGKSDPPAGPRTGFFEYVNPVVTPASSNTGDQFNYKVNPNACGLGRINFTVEDSAGFRVTTDEFSIQVTCQNDNPQYASTPFIGPLTAPENASGFPISLLTVAGEVTQLGLPEGAPLYGETATNQLVWEILDGHPSQSVSILTTWEIVGSSLVVTATTAVFHSTGAFDSLVVCVRDGAGLYPNNGTITKDAFNNACTVLRIQILDVLDLPLISTNGQFPAVPAPSPINVPEDTPTTVQVGIWDVDGPYPAVFSTSIVSDPLSIISSITFSNRQAVGTTGETWDMLITPSLNKTGTATVVLKGQTGVQFATQQLTIHVLPGNDPPTFTGIPCLRNPVSEKEDWGTTTSQLSFAVVTDVDLSDVANPSFPGEYRWSLTSVTYNGFIPVGVAESMGMTAVSSATTLTTPVAGSFVNAEIVQIMVGGDGSNGLITFQSNPFAYGTATLGIRITDQNGNGLFAENSQCSIQIESVTNPPVIRQSLFQANKTVLEDQEGYFFDLGPYELDPFNALTNDSDLFWSVNLAEPTTLFDIPANYPPYFRDFLDAENKASGAYNRMRFGPDTAIFGANGSPISPISTKISPMTTLTTRFLDPVSDRLFIRAAPDAHGTLPLILTLNRTNATPVTTRVDFVISPVNDPVRITMLDPENSAVAIAPFVNLEENTSVHFLNLTTWENDARDFTPVTTGNGLRWVEGQITSGDTGIFTISCPSAPGTKFQSSQSDGPTGANPAGSDNLCLVPNNNVAYLQASTVLNLALNDNGNINPVNLAVPVTLFGHNDYPVMDFLSAGITYDQTQGRYIWRVSEGAGARTSDLKPLMKDEEESLQVPNTEKTMAWYFDDFPKTLSGTGPGNLNKSLTLGGFPFLLTIDPVSKILTYNTTVSQLSGPTLPIVTMFLCDTGYPYYEAAPTNSTRTSRKCSMAQVQFVVEAINDPPLISMPDTILATAFRVNEGQCLSVDMEPFVTDPDTGISQISMFVSTTNGITNQDVNLSLFSMPWVTSNGFILNAGQLGREQNCSLQELDLETGPLSRSALRMFGSVKVDLVVRDNEGATSTRSLTLTWDPVWAAPSIGVSSQWSTSPLTSLQIWSVKEDSGTTKISLSTDIPDEMLLDLDLGYGEDYEDYTWSISHLGVQTDSLLTSLFSLKIETTTTGDFLSYSVLPNASTTGEYVTLIVTDSQGLMGIRTIILKIDEINDTPFLYSRPTICGIGAENSCLPENVTTYIQLADFLSDANDSPQDELIVRIVNNLTDCVVGPTLPGVLTTSNSVFATTVETQRLKITPLPHKFHPKQPGSNDLFGDILRLCVSDSRSTTQVALATTVEVFVRPVNDSPIITAPLDQVSFHLLEDVELKVPFMVSDSLDTINPGMQSYMRFTSERISDLGPNPSVISTSIYDVTMLGAELILRTKQDLFSSQTEHYRVRVIDEGDLWQNRFGPSSTTTSVRISLTSSPVNDAGRFCELSAVGCVPLGSLDISIAEDTSAVYPLNQQFKLFDPDNAAASSYAFSLEPSTIVTNKLYSLSSGGIVRFQLSSHLIGPNGRDSFSSVLSSVILTEETHGTVNNLNLYLHDTSEPQVLVSTLPINYVFQPINDPPRFTQTIPVIQASKNATQPVSVNLTQFKFDPDTALNQVCYSVVTFNPAMIQAYFPSGYGPAVFNQNNCVTQAENLNIFPLPGVSGSTSLQLAIYDTTDLSSATTSVAVQILATEPVFDLTQKPKVSELGLLVVTAPGVYNFRAQDLLIDDSPIVVNPAIPNFFVNTSDLSTILQGQRLTALNLDFFQIRINPANGELEITPDYADFRDGTRSFWLYYEDANGNIGKMVASITKRHAFLKSVRVDDVDGNGGLGFGDRLLLEFSETSGGVRGLLNGNGSFTALSVNNISQVVIGQVTGVDIAQNAYGIPTPYAVELYDHKFDPIHPSLAATAQQSGAYFVQLTLADGFNPNLNGVRTSHSLATPPFQNLRFSRDVTATSRALSIAAMQDQVPPRLMQARLIDFDKDTRYREGDRVQLRFSEVIKPLTQALDSYFVPSGFSFGGNAYYIHAGNQVEIVLGTGAVVDLNANPSILVTSDVMDFASNPVDVRRRQMTFTVEDMVGPRIIKVDYDKRSTGINYVQGDRIRIEFDEAVNTTVFNPQNLDSLLTLGNFTSFGSNPGIQFEEGGRVLIITLGALPSGLGPQVALRPSSAVVDLSGNASGTGELIASRGISLPSEDTLAPTAKIRYSRQGLIFDFMNPLTVINAGELLVEADFSEIQTAVPRISIENGSNTIVSLDSMSQIQNSSRPMQLWFYRHRIGSDDGLNRVILDGDSDPISGLALMQPINNSFFVDTLLPILQLPLLAGSSTDNALENRQISVTGISNEDLKDIRVTVLTTLGSVSASVTLNPVNRKSFQFSAINLNPGENRFRLVGTDMAGNPGELIKSIYYAADGTTGGGTTPGVVELDLDFDKDGVPNSQDVFSRDPSEWEDTDGDGVGDNADEDADGDGIPDELERSIVCGGRVYDFSKDSDNDGIPNAFDDDMDGDGIPNHLESGYAAGLTPVGQMLDFNNNGIPNYQDPDERARFAAWDHCASLGQSQSLTAVLGTNLTPGTVFAGIKDEILLIPQGGKDVSYDMSDLGVEYRELTDVVLPRTPDLEGLFPIMQVKPENQPILLDETPTGFEVVGKVLSIKGRVKAGKTVDFPFPLPSYFKNNSVVRTADIRLQYFDTQENKWVDSGTPVRIEGAIVYGRIKHFSDWRILRNVGSVFDNNAGGSLSAVSSGSGGGGGGGGCFIVTAASGKNSYLVQIYSRFRDRVLMQSESTRMLVQMYYEFSPTLAREMSSMPALKLLVLALLTLASPLVVLAGSGLLGLFFLALIGAMGLRFLRQISACNNL